MPAPSDDPMDAVRRWFPLARANRVPAVLATADADGLPSARWVDIVRIDHGFVFFTNYGSRKGRELAVNAHAALCFGSSDEGRQVTVRGPVERLEDLESDAYFNTLSRPLQLLVWASDQSREVSGPKEIERRLDDAQDRFAGQVIPRSLHWGGLRLVPNEVEFWKICQNGLQDRLRYQRFDDSGPSDCDSDSMPWRTSILAP